MSLPAGLFRRDRASAGDDEVCASLRQPLLRRLGEERAERVRSSTSPVSRSRDRRARGDARAVAG